MEKKKGVERKKGARTDPMARTFAKLRPTDDELARIKEAERSGDAQKFERQLAELDHK